MARKRMDYFARKEYEAQLRIDSALVRIGMITKNLPVNFKRSLLLDTAKFTIHSHIMSYMTYNALYGDMTDPKVVEARAKMDKRIQSYCQNILRLAEEHIDVFDDPGHMTHLMLFYKTINELQIPVFIGKTLSNRLIVAKLQGE